MYRPSQYNKSQASLEFFANHFNALPYLQNIRWICIAEESFDNDGYFVDLASGQMIGFDWEIRDDGSFEDGVFRYKTLGQYERKIKKSSIQLSVQCDSTFTTVMVAWHDDFKKEPVQNVPCKTDNGVQSSAQERYTDKFRIYSFSDMRQLKDMLAYAFANKCFDYRSFCMDENMPKSPNLYDINSKEFEQFGNWKVAPFAMKMRDKKSYMFATMESAYQACKTTDSNKIIMISAAKRASDALKISNDIIPDDGFEQHKQDCANAVVHAKVHAYPEMVKQLMAVDGTFFNSNPKIDPIWTNAVNAEHQTVLKKAF